MGFSFNSSDWGALAGAGVSIFNPAAGGQVQSLFSKQPAQPAPPAPPPQPTFAAAAAANAGKALPATTVGGIPVQYLIAGGVAIGLGLFVFLLRK